MASIGPPIVMWIRPATASTSEIPNTTWKLLKSLTFIYFEELFWVGSFCDVIAMTSRRDPTQNNSTFLFTKSDDLYRATIWLVVDVRAREIFWGGSNHNE